MNHQDTIYNQNGTWERNQTTRVVNTSSDICVFNIPFFSMSGASKIACDVESCDLNSVSFNDILTATTECFITNGLSGGCFNNIVWETKVYEDNVLAYTETFYTSSNSGDTPTIVDFSGSVVNAFDTLSYDYSFSGTQFSITQNDFVEIRIDINTEVNIPNYCVFTGTCSGYSEVVCDLSFSGLSLYSDNVHLINENSNLIEKTINYDCSCPDGYVDLGNGNCQKLTYIAATAPSSAITINVVTIDAAYIQQGAVIYEDITNKQWPLITTPQGTQSPAANALYNSIIPTAGTANGIAYTSISPAPLIGGQHQNVDVALPSPWPPLTTTGYGLAPRTYFNGAIRESVISSSVLYPGTGTEILPEQFLWGMPWSTGGTNTNNWFDMVGLWASGATNTPTNGQWFGFVQCIDIPVTKTYYIAFAGNNAARISLNGELMVEMNIGDGLKLTLTYANIVPITLSAGTHVLGLEGLNYSGNGGVALDVYDCDLATLTGITSYSALTAVTIFSTASKQGDVFETSTLSANSYSCPTDFLYSNCDGESCVKIESEACSLTSELSFTVSDETEIPLTFTFTANTSEFVDKNTTFGFEIFKYNKTLGYFLEPSLYKSEYYDWSSFSATSALTVSVPINSLNIDGEYLVKGYFTHDVCTEFALLNGEKITTPISNYGDGYKLYQSYRDFYFVALTKAEKPEFTFTNDGFSPIGSLLVIGQVLNGTETDILLTEAQGDYLIALNGLVLQEGLDYTISATTGTTPINVLTFNDTIYSGDVLTYAYTNSTTSNNLRGEGFEITSPIVSGTSGNQGSNLVYFNTTTGKYELYTELLPDNSSDLIVTVNGATLANNIDFYRSTSDPYRIILEGNLFIGDVINIFYNTKVTNQGNVYTTSFTVGWNIITAPQTTDGLFTVEFSNNEDFTTLLPTSATTQYVIGQIGYSTPITLSGSVGDVQYYRIKNQKDYVDLCGNKISSVAYSDIVDITIQTNAFNSY